jgi:hypothetical protein
MTATIDVDLDALEGMAAAVPSAGEGLVFSHVLTGDCTSALGCGAVATALSDVTGRLGRRAELLGDLLGRLGALPAEFAVGLRAVDECLAGQAAGGAAGGGGAGVGAGAGAGTGADDEACR